MGPFAVDHRPPLSLDHVMAKCRDGPRGTSPKRPLDPRPKLPEPARLGRLEADLVASSEDRRRHDIAHGLSKDNLRPALPIHEGIQRQREHELDQGWVEERHAALEGEVHRVPVLEAKERREPRGPEH